MPERRYDDAEIAEILALATRHEGAGKAGPPGSEPAPTGLTLAELQSIGSEVGIAPGRIAEAAGALERGSLASPPRLLGVPRAVGRIAPLPGPIEDRGWDRLVAELRSTFRAQGKVAVDGSLRSWRNGNLEVHVEPEAEGWRLRMQSFKSDAGPLIGLGFGAMAMGLLIGVTTLVGGGQAPKFVVAASFMAGGAGLVAWTRAQLGSWTRERAAQMEQLAAWAPGLVPGDRPSELAPPSEEG
jgi:hypothetical protein